MRASELTNYLFVHFILKITDCVKILSIVILFILIKFMGMVGNECFTYKKYLESSPARIKIVQIERLLRGMDK